MEAPVVLPPHASRGAGHACRGGQGCLFGACEEVIVRGTLPTPRVGDGQGGRPLPPQHLPHGWAPWLDGARPGTAPGMLPTLPRAGMEARAQVLA